MVKPNWKDNYWIEKTPNLTFDDLKFVMKPITERKAKRVNKIWDKIFMLNNVSFYSDKDFYYVRDNMGQYYAIEREPKNAPVVYRWGFAQGMWTEYFGGL